MLRCRQAAALQLLNSFPNSVALRRPPQSAFRIMMLVDTPAGDAYTFAELESISKNAGFAPVELAPPETGLVIAYW
jgi:hypothetical protein